MVGTYKGTLYWLRYSNRKKEIVTRNTSKADGTFFERKGIYSKVVDENDLTDIFSVDFLVDYDAENPHTPRTWAIDEDLSHPEKGQLVLLFVKGILPGWEVEDKNVCTKTIGFDDVTDIKISVTYKRKNGCTLDTPRVEERSITKDEMIELYERYNIDNL